MIFLVALAFVVHGQFGIEPCVIALTAAAVMLVISGADMKNKQIREVEWSTIGFFAGLFVVVGGMAETGVINMLAQGLIDITHWRHSPLPLLFYFGQVQLSLRFSTTSHLSQR